MSIGRRRGTAIPDSLTAQLPRLGAPVSEPDGRLFSPLNAPQRAAVEAFCAESRPLALRQARRTYRHLPAELQEQAVDMALRALRTGAPVAVDRRTLHQELATELTRALRDVHAGWCLNQTESVWRTEGPVSVPAPEAEAAVTQFVEDGLGGLERAVLQLEIGAGRDSRTARAALRLGPRQYARHREEGLSKLRSAIDGQLPGRVCEHHRERVTLAATGDRDAAAHLAAGQDRCRSCAREAEKLRRVLHQRLAVAPWPLAVKPAGILAAKAAAVGALWGKGGSITAALSTPAGSGAGAVATVLAAAALATGTAAVVGDSHDATPARSAAAHAAPATHVNAAAPAATAAVTKPASRVAATTAPAHKHHRTTSKQHATSSQPSAVQTAAVPASTTSPASSAGSTVQSTVHKTVDTVRNATKPVTSKLPATVQQPVNQVLDTTQQALDQVTNVAGGLLQPKK